MSYFSHIIGNVSNNQTNLQILKIITDLRQNLEPINILNIAKNYYNNKEELDKNDLQRIKIICSSPNYDLLIPLSEIEKDFLNQSYNGFINSTNDSKGSTLSNITGDLSYQNPQSISNNKNNFKMNNLILGNIIDSYNQKINDYNASSNDNLFINRSKDSKSIQNYLNKLQKPSNSNNLSSSNIPPVMNGSQMNTSNRSNPMNTSSSDNKMNTSSSSQNWPPGINN